MNSNFQNLRINFVLIISFIITSSTYSQKKLRFNYNSSWEITNSDTISFYRSSYFDESNNCFIGKVTDYYRDSKIEMTGYYSGCMKNGEFVFYYPNGQIKKKGKYLNDNQFGEWTYYYPNGQILQKLLFSDNDYTLIEYFDNKGNDLIIKGKAKWSYKFMEHGSKDTIKISGTFKNGLKSGVWYWRWLDGTKIITENYNKGKLLHKECSSPCESVQNIFNNKVIPDDYKFIYTEGLTIEGQPAVNYIIDDMPVPLVANYVFNPLEGFNRSLEEKLIQNDNNFDEPLIITLSYQVSDKGRVEMQNINCSNETIKEIITDYLLSSKWREGKRLGKSVSVTFSGKIKLEKDNVSVNLFNLTLPNKM